MSDTLPTLSIIGGTGALGGGLAARWAGAGYPVVLGSRSSKKAVHAAQEIDTGNNAPPVQGTDNKSAAARTNTSGNAHLRQWYDIDLRPWRRTDGRCGRSSGSRRAPRGWDRCRTIDEDGHYPTYWFGLLLIPGSSLAGEAEASNF